MSHYRKGRNYSLHGNTLRRALFQILTNQGAAPEFRACCQGNFGLECGSLLPLCCGEFARQPRARHSTASKLASVQPAASCRTPSKRLLGFRGFQDFLGSFGDQIAHAGGCDGARFARKIGRPVAAFQDFFNRRFNGLSLGLHVK